MERIKSLLRDQLGSVVIETAFVAPVLVLMGIGAFESGMMVSRHVELQNAAAEASQIAMSSPPADATERATLKSIIKTSTGLDDASVTLTEKFRCGTATEYVGTHTGCTAEYSKYIEIQLTDTYVPIWKKVAFGSNVNIAITRMVQIG